MNLKINKYNLLFSALLFSILLTMLNSLSLPMKDCRWSLTEYLINYQSGFIHRGLLGEGIHFLYLHYGIDVLLYVKIFCMLVSLSLFFFLFRDTIRRGYSLLLLPTALFLGNHFVNSNFWMRKDFLLLLLFYFYVRVLSSLSWRVGRFLCGNLILVFGILVHEIIFFLALPVTFIFFSRDISLFSRHFFTKRLPYLLLFLFPSLFCFALCSLNKGDATSAQIIWDSWGMILEGDPSGAINGLSWTASYAFERTMMVFTVFRFGIYYPLLWAALFLFVLLLFVRMGQYKAPLFGYKATADYNGVSSILIVAGQLFSLILVAPLFCDFSRLFVFIFITSYIIRLYFSEDYQRAFSSSMLQRCTRSLYLFAQKRVTLSPVQLLVPALIIGLPSINDSALEHVVLHGSVGLFFESIINTISILWFQCPVF